MGAAQSKSDWVMILDAKTWFVKPVSEQMLFDKVVALGTGEGLKTGAPFVVGAKVTAKVQKHGKGSKII
ncbi:hypothetical protein EBT25_19325, partial [bacterium]|nr:hypothetical protein [bacterium]